MNAIPSEGPRSTGNQESGGGVPAGAAQNLLYSLPARRAAEAFFNTLERFLRLSRTRALELPETPPTLAMCQLLYNSAELMGGYLVAVSTVDIIPRLRCWYRETGVSN